MPTSPADCPSVLPSAQACRRDTLYQEGILKRPIEVPFNVGGHAGFVVRLPIRLGFSTADIGGTPLRPGRAGDDRPFEVLHRESYPFGETRFDTGSTAFCQRGQFVDAIFEITRIRDDSKGRLSTS